MSSMLVVATVMAVTVDVGVDIGVAENAEKVEELQGFSPHLSSMDF